VQKRRDVGDRFRDVLVARERDRGEQPLWVRPELQPLPDQRTGTPLRNAEACQQGFAFAKQPCAVVFADDRRPNRRFGTGGRRGGRGYYRGCGGRRRGRRGGRGGRGSVTCDAL